MLDWWSAAQINIEVQLLRFFTTETAYSFPKPFLFSSCRQTSRVLHHWLRSNTNLTAEVDRNATLWEEEIVLRQIK